MPHNLYGAGMSSAGRYRRLLPEQDAPSSTLLDPRLCRTTASDEYQSPEGPHQLRQFIETAGDNSTNAPSPWTGHASYFSSQGFATLPALGPEQYAPSESPASLHWSSSASSIQNGPFERDPFVDPSTPGETRVLSPGTEIDPAYQGENYPSHISLTGLDCLSRPQDDQAETLYNYQSCVGIGDPELYLELDMQESAPVEACYPHTAMTVPNTVMGGPGVGSPILNPTSPMATMSINPETSYKAEESEIVVERKPSFGRTGKQVIEPSGQSAPKGVRKSQPRGRKKRPHKSLPAPSSASLTCRHCNVSFKDETSLDKHVKTLHTRPFICVFHYAGCHSTFATKNEWKRHVSSQHLYLEYYHCDYKGCATAKPSSNNHRFKSLPQYGNIFNRKDLYTQHARRMHQPENAGKKSTRQWEEQLKEMQKRALHKRCDLPREMFCPAYNCNERFLGEKAWDERMEHVARHLELAAAGKEPRVYFGGHHDPSLTKWAQSLGVEVVRPVFGGWELNNPVKGAGSSLDEDAEGEEI